LSNIGFDPAQIGILASFLNLAMGIVELEVGRVAGVFGRRWTLVAGYFFNGAAMVWLAQMRTWPGVTLALATVGSFRAMMWVPLFAEVAHTASAQTRGRAFGTFWFWTSVAFLIGPALGGLIVSLHGTRSAFYLGSAFSVVALPALIAATDPGRPVTQATVTGAAKVLKIPAISRLCTANLLYYSVTGIWMTFLPLYAAQQKISVLTIGWVFTLQGLTYALVQIPTGRLVDRLGPERLFIPALVGRAIIAAFVPLLHSQSAFLFAGAVFGLAGGFLPVPLTTLIARLVPQEHYTTAMGVYNSSGDLGFFIGPLLGGGAALLGILAPFFLCVPLGIAGVAVGLSGIQAAQRADAASL
jgi:MFS family permease